MTVVFWERQGPEGAGIDPAAPGAEREMALQNDCAWG